jgi:beta-phosphoglucomutase family hydrolase
MKGRQPARAVIWDMDGIIIDSAPYHLKAWQEVFSKRGLNFTGGDFHSSFGMRNDTIIGGFLGEGASGEEIAAIGREKEASFRLKIRQNPRPLPGVVALMAALAERGLKMAIASSAPRENIELVIDTLDIARHFLVIISEKDVTRGKPEPDGYLLAAKRLGVKPENCLVIEDAIVGVIAARRAGMHCLAVTNSHPRDSLSDADLVVDSLEEISASDVARLLDSPLQA